MQEIKRNPETFKILELPAIDLVVNLYSFVIKNLKGETKAIK